MKRLTRKNGCEVLLNFCDQFQKVTGESIEVAPTWAGFLDIDAIVAKEQCFVTSAENSTKCAQREILQFFNNEQN